MRIPYVASFMLLAACSSMPGSGGSTGGMGGSGGGSGDDWPTISGHRDPVVMTSMCAPADIKWGTPQKTDLQGGYFKSMAGFDFNGDGKADLAVLQEKGVEILISKGDGTFTSTFHAITNLTGNGLTTGDFTGTGFGDVITHGFTGESGGGADRQIALLLGKGDGTFYTEYLPSTSNTVWKMMGVDVNADNKLDMVFDDGEASNGLPGAMINPGNGKLGTPGPFPVMSDPSNRWTMGDLNGDKASDIVVVNPNHAFVDTCVIVNNKSAGFTASPVCYPALPSAGGDSVLFATADFNNDGKVDVFRADPFPSLDQANNVGIYLGKGDGTLGDPQGLYIPPPHGFLGVAASDVNNDGKLDILLNTGDGSDTYVYILLGNGDGTLAAPQQFMWGSYQSGSQQDPVVADFAGNGLRGVAVLHTNLSGGPDGIDVILAGCM